jgi:hypothetical protein
VWEIGPEELPLSVIFRVHVPDVGSTVSGDRTYSKGKALVSAASDRPPKIMNSFWRLGRPAKIRESTIEPIARESSGWLTETKILVDVPDVGSTVSGGRTYSNDRTYIFNDYRRRWSPHQGVKTSESMIEPIARESSG